MDAVPEFVFRCCSRSRAHSYYYRVLAKNDAGLSAPSNVVGPVRVEDTCSVDELSDYSRIFEIAVAR